VDAVQEEAKTVTNEARILHALEFRIFAKDYRAVIVWPGHEPQNPCCKLINPTSQSWLTIKAGDEVLLRRDGPNGRIYWQKRNVETVALYRVFPTEFNGLVVSSAQGWLDGSG
jgi:hypothetical protein